MSEQSILEDLIPDDEIAREFGVSAATVRRWAALGKLPPKVPFMRKPHRSRSAVKRILAELTGASTSAAA